MVEFLKLLNFKNDCKVSFHQNNSFLKRTIETFIYLKKKSKSQSVVKISFEKNRSITVKQDLIDRQYVVS